MVFRRENLTKLANFLVISKSIICKKAAISMIYRFFSKYNKSFYHLFISTHFLALTNASIHGVTWSLFILSEG